MLPALYPHKKNMNCITFCIRLAQGENIRGYMVNKYVAKCINKYICEDICQVVYRYVAECINKYIFIYAFSYRLNIYMLSL